MLKYVSKLAMDILPSVAATVIGAYIVNHYMVNRPAAEPAATASSVDPKKADAKTEAKTEAKRADATPEINPATGPVEKAVADKVEKPQEKPQAADKSPDRPADVASLPVEPRRHPPAPRDKAVAAAPASVGSVTTQPIQVEIPEEHRDANDLARAAIERLRASGVGSARTPETIRGPETTRVIAVAPSAGAAPQAAPIRPLPPPILVSTPPENGYESAPGSSPGRPLYSSAYPPGGIAGDPLRPTPPVDIPSVSVSPPLDLHADAPGTSEIGHKTVAEGMLSAAKSVLLAVLPK